MPILEQPSNFRLKRERIIAWLSEHVPEGRLSHILRVETMAQHLAEIHGVCQHRSVQAGLMHDLAKCFGKAQLLATARQEGWNLSSIEQHNPHVLHAEVGAVVARDTFAIKDASILNAIRNHTLGCPGMDLVSCVVFLADSLEPGRGDTEDLNHLRRLSHHSLIAAVAGVCSYTLSRLLAGQKVIHPRLVLTRNWAMAQVQSGKTSSKVVVHQ